MDLELSGPEALQNSKLNANRSWATVRRRIETGGLMPVQHTPRFTFTRDQKIFTMGSCFARRIEKVLEARGLPLLLSGHGVPAEHFESWDPAKRIGGGVPAGRLSRGALHKYNAHSMVHELRRVLRGATYPQEGLIEMSPGAWFDPHASGLRNLDLETALENRRRIDAATATVREAEVVFLTLGLTETWIDQETGLAMNRAPSARDLLANRHRFRFVDFGFRSILEEMEAGLELIREACNPSMRFIVTVSPVPLSHTFRQTDALVSVTASKSVLRAVAEELRRTFDFVDYFPSYEMVMHSPRELAWQSDQLHVAAPMVSHITTSFMSLYYGQEAPAAGEELALDEDLAA
jgi:hypothetical protein